MARSEQLGQNKKCVLFSSENQARSLGVDSDDDRIQVGHIPTSSSGRSYTDQPSQGRAADISSFYTRSYLRRIWFIFLL